MSILERITDYLAATGKGRVIYDRLDIDPYLVRYYVLPRWATLGLFRVVIHKFLASDNPEDGFHDHPWPYLSVVLKGGYYAHVLKLNKDGTTAKHIHWHGPGSVITARATRLHRVELQSRRPRGSDALRDEPAWTLFIMGPRVRTWGFVVDGVRHPWRDWLSKRAGHVYVEDSKWREYD